MLRPKAFLNLSDETYPLYLFAAIVILPRGTGDKGKSNRFENQRASCIRKYRFDAESLKGVRSDIDGLFTIGANQKIKTLTCSYMGYKTQSFNINELEIASERIIIGMEPLTTELSEVVVRPGYVNLFLSHNFGSLLFRSVSFSPEVSIHGNAGWGRLPELEVQCITGWDHMPHPMPLKTLPLR